MLGGLLSRLVNSEKNHYLNTNNLTYILTVLLAVLRLHLRQDAGRDNVD